MKTLKTKYFFLVTILTISLCIGCSDDDTTSNEVQGPQPTGKTKTYSLNSVADAAIYGTATIIEIDDNSIIVELDIQNTPTGGVHPAHIHVNTAVESGGVAISLTPVDGSTGKSSTNFNMKDDNTPISYNDLLDFDGYINVHLSASDLGTIVAQGDIGQNELTGTIKSYTLESKDVEGINGVAEFAERANGTTLVTLSLTGTPDGGSHPAHIHENDAISGGNIIVGLNPVNGTSGMSKTQVSSLTNGNTVSYNDFLNINAFINIHLSDDNLSTIVAQVNIGSNEGVPTTPSNTTNYDVTNTGSSAYVFNDSGFSNENNPNLILKRGESYTFTVNTPGHPFLIKSVQGTGNSNTYNNGVTNNGIPQGTISFTVPSDAPDTLFYNCEFHASMTGVITITN